jgi:hypothetical protein
MKSLKQYKIKNMEIRKCRKWTSYESGPVVELNPDDFRNLSIPFEGETDEEFLDYLESNLWEFEDLYDEIDKELYEKLMDIHQPGSYGEEGYKEYYNSSYKSEESWIESGETNDEFTKNGGFETHLSTYNHD